MTMEKERESESRYKGAKRIKRKKISREDVKLGTSTCRLLATLTHTEERPENTELSFLFASSA